MLFDNQQLGVLLLFRKTKMLEIGVQKPANSFQYLVTSINSCQYLVVSINSSQYLVTSTISSQYLLVLQQLVLTTLIYSNCRSPSFKYTSFMPCYLLYGVSQHACVICSKVYTHLLFSLSLVKGLNRYYLRLKQAIIASVSLVQLCIQSCLLNE